jgi:hypothetical protein
LRRQAAEAAYFSCDEIELKVIELRPKAVHHRDDGNGNASS